jgi:predicted thioesterase
LDKIRVGMTGRSETVVSEKNVAHGPRKVLSTPEMVRLMEQAASDASDPHLPAGWGTVGYSLDIRHVASAGFGAKVVSTAEIVEIDRQRISYRVEVRDHEKVIGEGRHERFAVDLEKFMSTRPAVQPEAK